MGKAIKQLMALMLVITMVTVPVTAQAAEDNVILHKVYTLEAGSEKSTYFEVFTIEESGNVTIDMSVKDLSGKGANVEVSAMKLEYLWDSDDWGKVAFAEKGMSDGYSIKGKEVYLEADTYVFGVNLLDWMITYPNGEPVSSGEKVEFSIKINGKGTLGDLDELLYGGVKEQEKPTIDGVPIVHEFKANYINTKKDLDKELFYYDVYFDSTYNELVMKVIIDKAGALNVNLGDYHSDYSSLKATLYKDADCTEQIGYSAYRYPDETGGDRVINIPKAGEYFMKFEVIKRYDGPDTLSFPVTLLLIQGNKTAKVGVDYIAYQDYDSGKIRFKLKVEKAGNITFNIKPEDTRYAYAYTTLLNSKKKAITEKQYNSVTNKDGDLQFTYSVAKGTYYIEVDTSVGAYIANWKFKEVKDKSGASKSKATNLKIGGKAVKGIVTPTDKTSKVDWFKFKLTASKKIKITLNYDTVGKLKVEVCNSKGKVLIGGDRTVHAGKNTLTFDSSKLSKGTYYIKISKPNSKGSGYYTIKVK